MCSAFSGYRMSFSHSVPFLWHSFSSVCSTQFRFFQSARCYQLGLHEKDTLERVLEWAASISTDTETNLMSAVLLSEMKLAVAVWTNHVLRCNELQSDMKELSCYNGKSWEPGCPSVLQAEQDLCHGQKTFCWLWGLCSLLEKPALILAESNVPLCECTDTVSLCWWKWDLKCTDITDGFPSIFWREKEGEILKRT